MDKAVSHENKPAGEIAGRIMELQPNPDQVIGADDHDSAPAIRAGYVMGFRPAQRAAATIAAEHEAKLRARIAEVEAHNERLVEALKIARRAIGDHNAPGDCYVTGPATGDFVDDHIECPACAFLAFDNTPTDADADRANGGDNP
jgi:hypothetical protein